MTAVLLLTEDDDFNALGSVMLAGSVECPVYRMGARLPAAGAPERRTGDTLILLRPPSPG